MVMRFTKGDRQELGNSLQLGAGIVLSQNVDGIPQVDVESSSVFVESDVDPAFLTDALHYVGGTVTNVSGTANVHFDGRYLGITAKAADSNLLGGFNPAYSGVANTVPVRDSAGDIKARLFRSEYTTLVSSAYANYIVVQNEIGVGTSNYLRVATPATVKDVLGVSAISAHPGGLIFGSVYVGGSTNGYSGIRFTAYDRTLMVNSTYQGFYQEGVGWKWRFGDGGDLQVGTVPWGQITGEPSTFPPAVHTHSTLENADDRTWSGAATVEPYRGFRSGFEEAADGWPMSYQMVHHFGSHTNGGGSMELAVPYIQTYNGGKMMYRVWDYDVGPWSGWRTFADTAWVGANYLGITAKAADSNLLDGYNLTSAGSPLNVALRDSSGDLIARLFRSEYNSVASASLANYIMVQYAYGVGADNYIRPATLATVKTMLGVSAISPISDTYGSVSVSGTTGGTAGIRFSGTTQLWSLLVDDTTAGRSGLYRQDINAWSWRWNNSVLEVGTVPAARLSGGTMAGSYEITGNVGIGSSPTYRLTVDSTATNAAAAAIMGPASCAWIGTSSTSATHYALNVRSGAVGPGSGGSSLFTVYADGSITARDSLVIGSTTNRNPAFKLDVENGLSAAWGAKRIYLYNSGLTLKLDAYDYATSTALDFSLGGNGGTVTVEDTLAVLGPVTAAGNVTAGDFYTNGFYRVTGKTGLYSQTYGTRFVATSSAHWEMWSNTTYVSFVLYSDNGANRRGYLYANPSGFGLLHSGSGWSVQCNLGSTGGILHGAWDVNGSLTAPSFYNERGHQLAAIAWGGTAPTSTTGFEDGTLFIVY